MRLIRFRQNKILFNFDIDIDFTQKYQIFNYIKIYLFYSMDSKRQKRFPFFKTLKFIKRAISIKRSALTNVQNGKN